MMASPPHSTVTAPGPTPELCCTICSMASTSRTTCAWRMPAPTREWQPMDNCCMRVHSAERMPVATRRTLPYSSRTQRRCRG